MSDTAAQLTTLRTIRAMMADPAQAAALDAAIAALEAQAPSPPTQTIAGTAQVGVAVAGDVHGHIFLAGQRGKTAAELLRAYLQRVVQRCGTLPLQGVREQKAADDVLRISLDQVYTQLATTDLTARERFEGVELTSFDAKAFLDAHRGARLLPSQQRTLLQHPPAPDEQESRRSQTQEALGARSMLDDMLAPAELEQPLDQLTADTLGKLAKEADWLAFAGPQLVTEAIATQPRLVLLGEPGSGKSTALRYLAHALAGLDDAVALVERLAGWEMLGDGGRLLPIFLPLLPLAKRLAGQPGHVAGAADLWNELAAYLEPKGANTGLAAAVYEELEAGRVLLLLDGLDEVAGTESRAQVVTAVRAFAEEYRSCRIVVACRVRAYEGEHNAAWQLPGWPTATLADWTIGQMEQFVSAWYHAAAAASELPDTRRDQRIVALQRAITTRSDLKRLGVRPLLLTIMALVHLNDGRLPEDRVTLYSRCIDILLAQWEVRGKDETVYGTLMEYIGLPDADVRSLRALLEDAAFRAHTASAPGNPGQLGRADLRELVMAALAERKHPNPYDGAQRFLEYTDVRAGLLQASDAGDAYVFPHQTFQEYLAGLKLVSGVGVVDRIMERRRDDRWRLPILLGLADHVGGNKLELPHLLLHRLLIAKGKPADEAQRDLLLAAEIAADVGWDRLERSDATFTELREQLATMLVSVVEGIVLPAAERVRAGTLLGTIGDSRQGVLVLPPSMVIIEGGSFLIGSTEKEAAQARLQYQQELLSDGYERIFEQSQKLIGNEVNGQYVTLSTFEIARYLVTNAQYALFIKDNGYDPDQSWWDEEGRRWLLRDDKSLTGIRPLQYRNSKHQPNLWDDERLGKLRPNHPVVGICWYEAAAFCHWLTHHQGYNPQNYSYRLPSEAEWEFAARGANRRKYPWGINEPDNEYANFDNQFGGTTAVGCFPMGATPKGIHDMAGNVWEWTCSIFTPYPLSHITTQNNVDLSSEVTFVTRGGGWQVGATALRATTRIVDSKPDYHRVNTGFRLARTLCEQDDKDKHS
jgi:formylglycine-generating enzyme required for sulfatase activity